VRRTQVYQISW